MQFHIVTIFPEAFTSYLNTSILKRGQNKGAVSFDFFNPRDYTQDKHRKVDDAPYGGGPGMVMKAEPIIRAVEAIKSKVESHKVHKVIKSIKSKVVILSPAGKQFTNKLAESWSNKYENITLICGHYEGIDARVKKILKAEEISVGPYTLTGGELASLVIIDAVTRRVPDVLGKEESIEEKRISSSEVYTRPEVIPYKNKKYKAPKVLLSGHHQKIDEWKRPKLSTDHARPALDK